MGFSEKESFLNLEKKIRSRKNIPPEYRSAMSCIRCGELCVFSKLKKLDNLCCRCYGRDHKRFTTVYRCTLCLVRTRYEKNRVGSIKVK